jgi:hypothetical protein
MQALEQLEMYSENAKNSFRHCLGEFRGVWGLRLYRGPFQWIGVDGKWCSLFGGGGRAACSGFICIECVRG